MVSYIVNGECLSQFEAIEDKTVDYVLVDLPYGQTACHWDTPIDLKLMWKELRRICKPATQLAFFCTVKFGHTLIHSNPSGFKYDLVWHKSMMVGFLNAKIMPMRNHEMLYIFNIGQPYGGGFKACYNPQKRPGESKAKKQAARVKALYGNTAGYVKTTTTCGLHPGSILRFNNPSKSYHPTQKPTDLCEWLIKSYSNEGDVVLDFTMGSGSTIVAAINTGRKYIGIEMDPGIFKTASKRINIARANQMKKEIDAMTEINNKLNAI
jgi:site-specific DNA-methyltransferase (adenine-specific)